ncbi:MAG: hypothetical protein OEO77_05530 [Acidimicrobiia bacterium]|nr:hypothetical protein [Acidimicrobiia bacterium]
MALLLGVLGVLGGITGHAGAATGRSLWVWDAPSPDILAFAGTHQVSDLYLHAPPGFSTDPAFGAFVADAQASGLRVHAMAGDPGWATNGDAWAAWAAEASSTGWFDGVVFDVEPYGLPDWSTKRQGRLIRSYLAGLDGAVQASGDLPVLAAIPFWFDEIKVKRSTLLNEVIGRVDGVVVMAYRDSAHGSDGIITHASAEVAAAEAAGKIVVIGVETADTGLDKVSFYEEGEAIMEGELGFVEQAFAGSSAYRGIAIHHYGSYRDLRS